MSDRWREITIIEQYNAEQHNDLLTAMFCQRGRVFGALGWDVTINSRGEERDKFDDMHPVYVISHTAGIVLGSLRLLPTTGPTLFEERFSDTIPNAAHLSYPGLWECTRLCAVDKLTTLELIEAVCDMDDVDRVICNFSSSMLRMYCKLGLHVEVLGHTDRYGDRVYLGLLGRQEAER